MNKQIPSYLKLVTDTTTESPAARSEDLAAWDKVCRAFEQATGWRLEYSVDSELGATSNLMWSAPVDPGVGAALGHIRLLSPEVGSPAEHLPIELSHAERLAEAMGQLWGELVVTRRALGQREAELAADVPVALHEGQTPTLGEQLQAVLRGGAEAIGCQAAALYLLDPATTELKLRSCWGLPCSRLAEPARPLRGALADLEALLGHAVVLVDDHMNDYWKVPEREFGASVCVPVSGASMPLGTFWVFSDKPRDFSDSETNILEIVAGRVAADLERQVLVGQAGTSREQTQQIVAAERYQQEQLPRIAPLVEGWEIAADVYHAGPVGGTFYDWFELEDGSLTIVIGDTLERGVAGALSASALRASARAFGRQRRGANMLLETANSILWTGSTGGAAAGLAQIIIAPRSGQVECAAAGPMRLLALCADASAPLGGQAAPLGLQETTQVDVVRRQFAPRELLVAYGTNFTGETDPLIFSALDDRLALALEPHVSRPASKLVEIAAEILRNYPAPAVRDQVVVLLKRRR